MPSSLQKPAPANVQRASDQSPSGASPATGNHHSQTYTIDIVQTLRVSSNDPLTHRGIDSVTKSLGKLGDRGYVSDDETGARLRVVQTALQVVRGSGTKSSSPSPPPYSGSPGGSGRQQQGHPIQPPKRILFYHAQDPYYGFTNFSPDPVEYQGKSYPTSEHLFQSLKVSEEKRTPPAGWARYVACPLRGWRNPDDAQAISHAIHSSSITALSWRNTSGRARLVRASSSMRPTDLIQRSGRTGFASESRWCVPLFFFEPVQTAFEWRLMQTIDGHGALAQVHAERALETGASLDGGC